MVKKRILFITLNVFLALVLCVVDVFVWTSLKTVIKPEKIIRPPTQYVAYTVTTKTDERGVPIEPTNYPKTSECDCYYPQYLYGKLYYYDTKTSTPEVKETKNVNLMGVKMQAQHYETKRMGYSSYFTELYRTEDNGAYIGYKQNTDILTYYKRSGGYNVSFSDEAILSETMLREKLDPHASSYVDISEFEFSYYLERSDQFYSYEEFYELEDYTSKSFIIHAKYQRYINGIPTNEVLSYKITYKGLLYEFELSGYGEFEDSSDITIDNGMYRALRDAEMQNVFIEYTDATAIRKWERLANIDGQYIMVIDVYAFNTLSLAVPITSAPENAPVTVIPEERYELPRFSVQVKITATIESVLLLASAIIGSILILRKKSTSY